MFNDQVDSFSKPLTDPNDKNDQPLIPKNQTDDFDGEEQRLGRKSPLRTIFNLSAGPLVSELVISLYGIVNSLWVANSIGSEGVEVFGAVFIVEFVAIALGEYLLTCVAIRASFCFGEGEGDKVSQLYVDFIRIGFIFGIITPCIILPITKPIVHWFGANEHLSEMCLQYMIPSNAGCFFNFIYQISLGLMQAEGRSVFYGIIQVISFGINIALLAITLLWLKLPIWGASLSQILSEGIPGIILFFVFFSGKFSIHPKMKMFCSRFSDETRPALKVGLASLIVGISYTLPLILMQKYVNNAATAIGAYNVVIQVWGVIEKVYSVVGGICVGFNYGFVPAASFAFGAKRYDRVKKLSLHMLWVSTLFSSIISFLLILFPSQVASLWNKDPEFLYWSKKMIPKVYYACVFIAIQYMVPGLLQSLQLVFDATVLSFITLLIPYPIFSTVLYLTNKKDPARVLYTYCLSDCFSCVVCTIYTIRPFRMLSRLKEEKEKMSINESIPNDQTTSFTSYTDV